MFSQQTIKRMHLGGGGSGGLNYGSQFVPQGYSNPQQMYHYQEMSNNPYQQMNNFSDNMSYYSSASTNSSLSNLKRKNTLSYLDDINSILASSIESLIPKISQECAELVYSKISSELDKQAKEIDDLKNQLAKFEKLIQNKNNKKRLGVNSTPMKNLNKVNSHLNKIEETMDMQSRIISENSNINHNSHLETLKEKVNLLKECIKEERDLTEKLNSNMKDKQVDLLGLKSFIGQKINYLMNEVKLASHDALHSSEKDNITANIKEINCIINGLVEDINNKTNPSYKGAFENLQIDNCHGNSAPIGIPQEKNIKQVRTDHLRCQMENNFEPHQIKVNKEVCQNPKVNGTPHGNKKVNSKLSNIKSIFTF